MMNSELLLWSVVLVVEVVILIAAPFMIIHDIHERRRFKQKLDEDAKGWGAPQPYPKRKNPDVETVHRGRVQGHRDALLIKDLHREQQERRASLGVGYAAEMARQRRKSKGGRP